MTPDTSLLSRARAYLQNRAGRTALAAAPLATLGLAAAGTAQGDTAVFDPAAAFTYGNDSNGIFQYDASGGGLRGSSNGTNSDGVTGATFDTGTGTGGVVFEDFEGGHAGTVGTIQLFSIKGVGSGTINPANASAQISYDFTLTSFEGFVEAIKPAISEATGPAITGGTLALSVTTDAGTFTQDIALDATGIYIGTAKIATPGTMLLSYSAVLTANYTLDPVIGDGLDATITATVPMAASIDFTAVPEPSTWVILATGVAGAGWLKVMRVRERRAKAAPTTA